MVSNTSNNSSCGPTVNSSTCDDSLVQLVYGGAATSSSFSSIQESLPQPSNPFGDQHLINILGEAIKIVQEDDLFFPTKYADDDLFMTRSHGTPKQ